jgi:predicted RND superfamily exporter protein
MLFVPFILGFNLMSMNVTSFPRMIPFSAVLIIAIGLSVILMGITLVYTCYIRKAFSEIDAEKNSLKEENFKNAASKLHFSTAVEDFPIPSGSHYVLRRERRNSVNWASLVVEEAEK